MYDFKLLEVPEYGLTLNAGCKLKLGRFSKDLWILQHGWYSWGGNRPFCGWFLTNVNDPSTVKPLQKPDLADIILVER